MVSGKMTAKFHLTDRRISNPILFLLTLTRFIGLTSINPPLTSNTSSGLMSGASGPLSEAVKVTPLTPELSIFR
jgi:hypothetical protein